MAEQNPSRIQNRQSEDGYMLLAVVVMVTLVLIALSVAAPIIAKDVRRQKELESERRALDYERAIRVYYRKNKSYPANMDAILKGTNNIRYLRRKWIDPLTGKDDWRIIHTPKTKTHFPFGEEIAGGMGAGLGSAAGMSSSPTGTGFSNNTTNVGQTGALAAGFGGASVASPTTGGSSTFGASPGSPVGSSSSSSDAGMFGDSSGGPIYGVATARSGDSILTPNQQTTYETWEFWYDPQIELFYQKGNPLGGGGVGSSGSGMGSTSATGVGQNAATGQSNSGGTSSFGNGSFGNGNNGTTSNGTLGTNP